MPDSQCKECYDCSEKFTTFRRRHHCRLCGQIFCSRCCNQEIPGKFMGYTGRVYLLRNRTVSVCSALFGLLRLRSWRLLENVVRVCSGLKNKEKESQGLILPVSLWKMVDYAMPANFYHTKKQIWPLLNKGVQYKKYTQGKASLSNSSFKVWATCFNWGWGEYFKYQLPNSRHQLVCHIRLAVVLPSFQCVLPPSSSPFLSSLSSFTDLVLGIICLGKIPWACNYPGFCRLREYEN